MFMLMYDSFYGAPVSCQYVFAPLATGQCQACFHLYGWVGVSALKVRNRLPLSNPSAHLAELPLLLSGLCAWSRHPWVSIIQLRWHQHPFTYSCIKMLSFTSMAEQGQTILGICWLMSQLRWNWLRWGERWAGLDANQISHPCPAALFTSNLSRPYT